jgi:hypothetical protein
MDADEFDNTAQELLRAAERSLFDATVRLGEALAAMDGRGLTESHAVLAQAREWSKLIAHGLDRMGPTRDAPVGTARPRSRRVAPPRVCFAVSGTVVAKA